MSVRILIQRRFKAGASPENLTAINQLRIGAMRNKGYVGGETLVSLEDQREVLVISTWSSIAEWNLWSESSERKALDEKLALFLEGPVRIQAYNFGADAFKEILEQAVHDADAAGAR